MRVGIIPAEKINSRDLRASSYVLNPDRVAKDLVTLWAKNHPVLSRRSPALLDLERRVAEVLREALER